MKLDFRLIRSKFAKWFRNTSLSDGLSDNGKNAETVESSPVLFDADAKQEDISWNTIAGSEVNVSPPPLNTDKPKPVRSSSDASSEKTETVENKKPLLSGTKEDFLQEEEAEEKVTEIKEEIPWKYRNKKLKICLTVFVLLVGIIHAFPFPKNIFYVNHTISAPRGVYVRNLFEPWKKGDMVIVESPYKLAKFEKGTIFLKKVVGTYGDRYEITENALLIGNERYLIHREQVSLPQQDVGIYSVPQFQVLLLNDMEYSFDGRYFGPLPQSSVKGRMDLLFTFYDIEKKFDFVPIWLKERLRDRFFPAKRKTA